jgi:phosphohistidine phosphatase
MKSLLLIRHAKSSWNHLGLDDFDRPLNDRGKRNAPEMAERLFLKKIKIDAFVSSTAKRALKTAEAFAKQYGRKEKEIITHDELYHASPSVFKKVIASLPDEFDTVAMFSHNPGITEFVNSLTTHRIDNMPTCAVFAVRSKSDTWAEFDSAEKELWFFDYPKAGED